MYINPLGPTAILITIISYVLQLYIYIIIAAVVMSWLLAFNVVNYHNDVVRMIVRILNALTEPVFRFVRRFIPPIGGLDLSPIAVFFAIWILQAFVVPWIGLILYRIIG